MNIDLRYAADFRRRPLLRWLVAVIIILSTLQWAGRARADDPAVSHENQAVIIRSQTLTPDGVQSVIEIPAQQDSFISAAHPTANYGFADSLWLGYDAASYQAVRLLLKFDLSSIPANGYINTAHFEIYQASATPGNDYGLGLLAQYVKANWDEGLVTWDNVNTLGGPTLSVGEVTNLPGWETIDATQFVRDWHSGTQVNYGLLITGDESPAHNRSRVFFSRQKPGYPPRLVVDYLVNCDAWAPAATVNTLPAFSPGSYPVTWSGDDAAPPGCTPTGIAYYDVQYRINGQAWVTWVSGTSATSRQFFYAGDGDSVEFRARAADRAGNVQAFGNPQAATHVDTLPPASTLNALPPYTIAPAFTITWSGHDNLSGVQYYDVQVRAGDGPWEGLIENTIGTTYLVTGAESGQIYRFRVHAVDNANNSEPWPADYQAITTVFDHPITVVDPIQPGIIKPTSAVTDSIRLNWMSYAAPDIPINRYEIWARYQDNPWTLWQDAVAGASTTITFTWLNQSLGGVSLGDGRYEFEILAIPNIGNSEPRTAVADANTYVDMADVLKARVYLPIVTHSAD